MKQVWQGHFPLWPMGMI